MNVCPSPPHMPRPKNTLGHSFGLNQMAIFDALVFLPDVMTSSAYSAGTSPEVSAELVGTKQNKLYATAADEAFPRKWLAGIPKHVPVGQCLIPDHTCRRGEADRILIRATRGRQDSTREPESERHHQDTGASADGSCRQNLSAAATLQYVMGALGGLIDTYFEPQDER